MENTPNQHNPNNEELVNHETIVMGLLDVFARHENPKQISILNSLGYTSDQIKNFGNLGTFAIYLATLTSEELNAMGFDIQSTCSDGNNDF